MRDLHAIGRIAAMGTLVLAAACASVPDGGRFSFGIIGDMPYTKVQEGEYRRVLAALNGAELAFVAHVGDFQFDARPYNQDPARASMPCVEESYKAAYEWFQSVRHPFILTPGDNDWTDCWPLKARKVDPLQLLTGLRSRFYPEGRSLGQRPMAVVNQSTDTAFARFRENLAWSLGGVTFVTVHIVGSNDNFGRTPEMNSEHLERKAANLAWIKRAFAQAKSAGSRGIVILTQANPGFENFWPAPAKTRYFIPFIARGQPLPSPKTAFGDYVAALAAELEGFDKPVLYVHGDTHLFRVDKPLYSAKTGRVFENFTRVETFGWPDSHWVRIEADPGDPQLFTARPQIVPENRVSRQAK
jgi:hypothetical protein